MPPFNIKVQNNVSYDTSFWRKQHCFYFREKREESSIHPVEAPPPQPTIRRNHVNHANYNRKMQPRTLAGSSRRAQRASSRHNKKNLTTFTKLPKSIPSTENSNERTRASETGCNLTTQTRIAENIIYVKELHGETSQQQIDESSNYKKESGSEDVKPQKYKNGDNSNENHSEGPPLYSSHHSDDDQSSSGAHVPCKSQ